MARSFCVAPVPAVLGAGSAEPARPAMLHAIAAAARDRHSRLSRGSMSARLVSDEFREPSIGRLGRALERLEIDVDYAEAAAVAFRPLEVIQQ